MAASIFIDYRFFEVNRDEEKLKDGVEKKNGI
jgi:hypothetical protein